MTYKDLKLNYEKEYSYPQLPDDIPPKAGKNDTPFFSQLVVGTRGYGKTYSTLQQLQNIDDRGNGFYNVFYCVSPTRHSDLKQKTFFKMLEDKGRIVHYFDEFDHSALQAIRDNIESDLKNWEEYYEIFKIVKKFKQGGQKAISDAELLKLMPFIDEEAIDGKGKISLEDVINQFPEYIQRDYPPCSYVYIDDSFGSKLLCKTTGYNPLTYLLIRHRHLKMSISLLVQSLSGIPRAIRSNCVLWCVYPIKSKKEQDILFQECANVFKNINNFDKALQLVEKEPYGFLYIDSSSTKEPDVRIGFNQQLVL